MEGISSQEKAQAPVSLRKAVADDLPFLFNVSTQAMRPVVETLNPDKVFDEEKELAKYTAKFVPEEIEIIRFQDRDVGRLRVVRSPESIYVGGIQILPEFQGKSIGTAIFSDLIRESEESGLPIILEVHDVNEQALSFYRKLGFVDGEQVKDQTVMRYLPNKR